MIKKISLLICLVFASANANAGIMFEIDGPGSSVVTGTGFDLGGASLSLALDEDLDGQMAVLGVGESFEFDFFSITAESSNWALMVGEIEATLAFASPSSASASASGLGGAAWGGFFALNGAGGVSFDDFLGLGEDPEDLVFADGSIASIDFIGVGDTCRVHWGNDCTLSGTVRASVTLIEAGTIASVPEPSIIALMGAGLLGLGFARRRKQQA